MFCVLASPRRLERQNLCQIQARMLTSPPPGNLHTHTDFRAAWASVTRLGLEPRGREAQPVLASAAPGRLGLATIRQEHQLR